MPLSAQGSHSWICIPAFLGNFGCFPRDLGMSGSLRWDPGDSRIADPKAGAAPGRKNHLEKPIFPGLGWPGAGSSGSRQGLGWIWEYLEPKSQEGHPGPIPEPWNERELLQSGIFPKIPILDPWSRDGGDFLGGEIPNPRLWSSWEPGMNPVNWIPVINWIPVVPRSLGKTGRGGDPLNLGKIPGKSRF